MVDPSHRERMEQHREEMEQMDRWFWRIFYASIAVIVLSIMAMIAGVIFLGMHVQEIMEFLRGFQWLGLAGVV